MDCLDCLDRLDWYRIPEIPLDAYVDCVKDVYRVLEDKHHPKGEDDLFMRHILQSRFRFSDEQWRDMEHSRRIEKAIAMKMGNLHEQIAGSLPGYKKLCVGHVTGCDVMKLDGTEIWEFKNRENTLNHGSAKHAIRTLEEHANNGMIPFLVFVNCKKKTVPRFKAPPCIRVLNGQQAYAHMSGRETFYEDLRLTLADTFTRFPTYASLQTVRKITHTHVHAMTHAMKHILI